MWETFSRALMNQTPTALPVIPPCVLCTVFLEFPLTLLGFLPYFLVPFLFSLNEDMLGNVGLGLSGK